MKIIRKVSKLSKNTFVAPHYLWTVMYTTIFEKIVIFANFTQKPLNPHVGLFRAPSQKTVVNFHDFWLWEPKKLKIIRKVSELFKNTFVEPHYLWTVMYTTLFEKIMIFAYFSYFTQNHINNHIQLFRTPSENGNRFSWFLTFDTWKIFLTSNTLQTS